MLEKITPGQTIRCTVVKTPRTEDRCQTILRLMRMDPATKRGLRRAQERRRRNMVSYSRGGREWFKRERVGKLAKADAGQTWTMPYTPALAADFRSVEGYVSVEGL